MSQKEFVDFIARICSVSPDEAVKLIQESEKLETVTPEYQNYLESSTDPRD